MMYKKISNSSTLGAMSLSQASLDKLAHSKDDRAPLLKRTQSFKDFQIALEKNKQEQAEQVITAAKDYRYVIILFVAALFVRLVFIYHPSVVIFDEVHFGSFANHYLKGEFFMDVHPPLAKLLVAFSALIGNWSYSGDFSFARIGMDYLHNETNVPYVYMRAAPALLNALTVPILYKTLRGRKMNVRSETAILASIGLILENAFLTQSRLILLDSYLLFFIAAAIFCWLEHKAHPVFSRSWWKWMMATGAMMGCAASCKWVGLFLIASIGAYTTVEIWQLLGTTTITNKKILTVIYSKFLGLAIIPFIVYCSIFALHFAVATKFTQDASIMSIPFQHSLDDHNIQPTFAQLSFGSSVTIRQVAFEGGYLHSHADLYPSGSKQQQVTGYPHRDQNNLWIIRSPNALPVDEADQPPLEDDLRALKWIRNGDVIRLLHVNTDRFLHSHPIEPPLSHKDNHHEVSGYGLDKEAASDTNDHWRIEIVDKAGNPIIEDEKEWDWKASMQGEEIPEDMTVNSRHRYTKQPVYAMKTYFRLVHVHLGCVLQTARKPLPEWGYRQHEMTCGRETLKTNSIFVIESNVHPRHMPESPIAEYESAGFWSKFFELNWMMWQKNSQLAADHPFATRPLDWLLLKRGLGFWNGNDGVNDDNGKKISGPIERFKDQQIYLLGNPAVWWMASACIIGYSILLFLSILTNQRGVTTIEGGKYAWNKEGGFLFVTWVCHFVPFFFMNRQLFLHHYLPAYYVAICLAAFLFDRLQQFLIEKFGGGASREASSGGRSVFESARWTGIALLIAIIAWGFVSIAPLSYGMKMTTEYCQSIRFLSSWDFNCDSITKLVKMTTGK